MLAKLLSGLFVKRGSGREPLRDGAATRRAFDAYVAAHPVRKLHLGAGSGSPASWLSTDLLPASDSVLPLDATEAFPIEDGTFDYVFSEHMIEHLPWHEGLAMLRECRRVLKPAGTIRVATPDLAVILALYREPREPMAERYVRFIVDRALPGINDYNAAFVINNAFRNWGHQFLYDAPLLKKALYDAGFANMRRCAYGESPHPDLRGIECHGRNIGDEAIAAFETMVFEADCPRA